jgi:transcriptional regulator with XRE-family HTH domain
MDIGFAIWVLRTSLGMSQNQLASRMKTSRQQVSDLEIFQMPTVATLYRIARALRVTPRCLLQIAEVRGRRESAPQLKRGA